MFSIKKNNKKINENSCCRYCKFIKIQENETYLCKYKGKVKASGVCKKYVFDPFAHRIPRLRAIDTSMFDPLDFRID